MRRLETLYRVMYESFTPEMMRRMPFWLKRRIAAKLGYILVRDLSVDGFMAGLFMARDGQQSPMSVEMFESSVGGLSLRPFFSFQFHWRFAQRVWRGETHTPEQLRDLAKMKERAKIEFPGFTRPPIQGNRRRLS
jgi:hypothetical protein